jgi:hypothetical protein
LIVLGLGVSVFVSVFAAFDVLAVFGVALARAGFAAGSGVSSGMGVTPEMWNPSSGLLSPDCSVTMFGHSAKLTGIPRVLGV